MHKRKETPEEQRKVLPTKKQHLRRRAGKPGEPGASGLSHVVGALGRARSRMVDVGAKAITARTALARAIVRIRGRILPRLLERGGPKGPLQELARAAGVLAAKRTGELIPLCHPLGLDFVDVEFRALDRQRLEILCRTNCRGRTGVEMEALVGAALAALTVVDMTKALDPGVSIERLELLEKRGGRSGPWRRENGGPE